MIRTIEEINVKIKTSKVVVVTAEEWWAWWRKKA